MQVVALDEWAKPNTGRMFDTGMVRRWSSPETILVVTDLLDVESVQFHAMQQARRSRAKVLLVQVERQDSTAVARTHHLHRMLSSVGSDHASSDAPERMARYLRGAGIACEPIVVRSVQTKEIPSIASSCRADRVLVSTPIDQSDTVADEIIDGVEIPVCVVSRSLSVEFRLQRPTRRVTLVLSLHAKNEIPIALASRFAGENHSQLTIMHVFPRRPQNGSKNGKMVASFISRLPATALRKAKLICPVEIVLREGDPTSEILKYDSSCNQDFVILAPPREACPIDFGMSAVRTIIREARCPVFVLTECS
jgi:hypothetical protein